MSDCLIIKQLEKLIEVSIALTSKEDTEHLLEMILFGAKSITGADGGTLYSIQKNSIRMEIVHSTSLNLWQGGKSQIPIKLPEIPLYNEDGSPNLACVVSYCYHKKATVNIVDAYNNDFFDFSGTKKFDQLNNYRSKSFLSVPFTNHENDIVGVLQLINATNFETKKTIGFDEISQRFTEALTSQAALLLTKQGLINDLESMFESLIHLIATAIDDKSPYTGDHCRRVPELTMMLAEAAHNTHEGYLKDFFMTDSDRYELKIAGWLHDCGKITTPEHVIDKATKLETIFDRLELIQTRFEVLKRDAHIKMLEQKIINPTDNDTIEAAYHQKITRLDDDFVFIKKVNTGGEFMTHADKQRILTIAEGNWLLDKKIMPILSKNEVDNLLIERGTLTAIERQIINHHIVTTIAMLNQIKFPKHLKNVLEYAGGHHERMDGKGYPNGLTRNQMSIQARVMGIADIFEALTAADRPYKPAKSLSQSLAILKKMKDDHHIDPDLYDVFLKEKIYLQYAQKFLSPTQIDVD